MEAGSRALMSLIMAACACCASAFAPSTMLLRGNGNALTGELWAPACRLHQSKAVQTRRRLDKIRQDRAYVAMAADSDEPKPAKRTVSSGRPLRAIEGRDCTSHPRRASAERKESERERDVEARRARATDRGRA